MLRSKLFLIVIVAGLGLGIAGCGKKPENNVESAVLMESQGIPIFTAKSKLADIEDKITSIGVVYPFEQNNIYSKGSGRLVKYMVEEGQIVKKDDIIAYIDRDEVGYEFTQNPVKSPASGVLLKKYLDVGATVSAMMGSVSGATPIASVGDISKVKIILSIVESDIGRVKVGQPAEVFMEAYPGKKFRGSVYTVAPTADPASHTSKVEILLDNKEGLVKSGMSAKVEIVVGKKNSAVVIPRNALIRKAGEVYIFVVDKGLASKRLVESGFDDGENLEIKKGLKSGETIADSDFNILQDGLKIKETTK